MVGPRRRYRQLCPGDSLPNVQIELLRTLKRERPLPDARPVSRRLPGQGRHRVADRIPRNGTDDRPAHRPQKERWCYVKLKDEPAARVLSVSTAGENPLKARRKTSSGSPNRLSPTIRIWCNESRATNFRSGRPLKLVKAYEAIVTYRQGLPPLPLPNGRRKDKTKESVRRL